MPAHPTEIPGSQPAPPLRSALLLARAFALTKLAVHLATTAWVAHLGWGYFRDEFYYIACGRHYPQFFADRFGWQKEADEVSRILASLSPEGRARVTIRGDDYGDAASLQFLAFDLPAPIISGQKNYRLWGPGPHPGDITHDSIPFF